jgi:autotransporter-associated beta strand protein
LDYSYVGVVYSRALRPALYLNLESVIFASAAGNGKSSAVEGSWKEDIALSSAPPNDAIKYTILDESIPTPELTLKQTLEFDFANASNGSIVAGLIHDPDTGNNAYAKLNTTAGGEGDFELPGTLPSGILPDPAKFTDGTYIYILNIYGEKIVDTKLANKPAEEGYSDFAGNPITFEADVDETGEITLLTLVSDVPFGLDDGVIGLKDKMDYTEPWTIESGGGTLLVKKNQTATISGRVTGASNDLTKTGDGKLILNAPDTENSTVGTVDVEAGSLIVGGKTENSDASLTAASVTVEKDALLGGHGKIVGDVTIAPGGILSPGNSIGEFTIENTLTLAPGAYFDVEVNPQQTLDEPHRPGRKRPGRRDRLAGHGDLDRSHRPPCQQVHPDGRLPLRQMAHTERGGRV